MPGRAGPMACIKPIEAKENVTIEQENKPLATITFQNYFRMYKKLAGMTGTAETEAEEFYKIYKLEVLEVPTHRDMIRADYHDVIYKTERGKFRTRGRGDYRLLRAWAAVLVGTSSVEKSEVLAKMLRQAQHQPQCAECQTARAGSGNCGGRRGGKAAVTIATNMAVEATDIVLGRQCRGDGDAAGGRCGGQSGKIPRSAGKV